MPHRAPDRSNDARTGRVAWRSRLVNRRQIPLAVMALLVCYGVLFYRVPLPSLGGIRRGTLVLHALLLPDALVRGWFGVPAEPGILDRLPIVIVGMTILLVAAAAGYLVVLLLRIDRHVTRLETLLFSLGVGAVMVSTAVLAVGLAGLLDWHGLLSAPAAVVVAVAAWRVGSRLRRPADFARYVGKEAVVTSWISPKWLWLMLPWVAVVVLGGLLPPIDFDVREYHLQVPKEFFLQGRIVFLPHNVYGNMPLGPQMFSLLGMVALDDWWHGALVGKLLIALFVPLTSAMLYAAGRRWFSSSAGVVAAVVYGSIPWMVRVSNLGLIEGVYAFYLFAALYAFWLWQDVVRGPSAGPVPGSTRAGRTGWLGAPAGSVSLLFLAGLLAGGAVTCKYPALVFVALPLGFWAWTGPSGRWPARWRVVAIYALAVVVSCGLWFGKNLVLTGNPVYPLLANELDGATRTPAKIGQWQRAHRPPNFAVSDAVGRIAGVALCSEWISPLVLPLSLLALVTAGRGRLVVRLWAYVGYVLFAWWLLTHRIDRFWIPILPVMAMLAGIGATWSAALWWRRTCWTFLALGLAANFLMVTGGPVGGSWGPGGYNRFFVSYDSLRASPERVDPWHRWLNEHVPWGHAVLAVGDAEVFDLEMPVAYHTVFDDSILEQALRGRTPAEFHRWLEGRNVSHIWVHWGEIARYRSPGNYGFPSFVTPSLFQRLVRQRVLAPPLPKIAGHAGQVFVVLPSALE